MSAQIPDLTAPPWLRFLCMAGHGTVALGGLTVPWVGDDIDNSNSSNTILHKDNPSNTNTNTNSTYSFAQKYHSSVSQKYHSLSHSLLYNKSFNLPRTLIRILVLTDITEVLAVIFKNWLTFFPVWKTSEELVLHHGLSLCSTIPCLFLEDRDLIRLCKAGSGAWLGIRLNEVMTIWETFGKLKAQNHGKSGRNHGKSARGNVVNNVVHNVVNNVVNNANVSTIQHSVASGSPKPSSDHTFEAARRLYSLFFFVVVSPVVIVNYGKLLVEEVGKYELVKEEWGKARKEVEQEVEEEVTVVLPEEKRTGGEEVRKVERAIVNGAGEVENDGNPNLYNSGLKLLRKLILKLKLIFRFLRHIIKRLFIEATESLRRGRRRRYFPPGAQAPQEERDSEILSKERMTPKLGGNDSRVHNDRGVHNQSGVHNDRGVHNQSGVQNDSGANNDAGNPDVPSKPLMVMTIGAITLYRYYPGWALAHGKWLWRYCVNGVDMNQC
jgi:hypothetical protein